MSLANSPSSSGRKAKEWRERKGPQDFGLARPWEKLSVDLADKRLGHLDNCPASRLIPERGRKLSHSSLAPSPKQVKSLYPFLQFPGEVPGERTSLGDQRKNQEEGT